MRVMHSKNSVLMTISFVCLSIVVAVATLYGVTLRERRHANELLQNVVNLRLGLATFEDAQHLAEAYGGRPWGITPDQAVCSAQKCDLVFRFENKPLSYLPWVRRIVFTADLTIKDNLVVARNVYYERHSMYRRSSEVDEEFLFGVSESLDPNPKDYGIKRRGLDSAGIPEMAFFTLGPQSTPEERTRAYHLDLSCLASLFDCNNRSAIIPKGFR